MSRCYPYPPPFLLESEIRKKKDDEKSLFLRVKDESIKKREEIKKERKKEKKREKKEKNEKKKKVQNIRENGVFENKEHTQRERYKDEGSKIDHNEGSHPKRREDEDEEVEVEKSGLTEEHDQPISLQNLGNISDSSQDSRKRKRTHIPMPTSSSNGCHNFGNVLRFRLSLSKNKDHNKDQVVVLPPSSKVEKSSCCTPERPERVVQKGIDDGNPSRSVSSQLCSTSGTTITTEILLTQHKGTETAAMAGTNCFNESCLLDTVEYTQYRNLIENWTPPSQSLTVCCPDLDDQDWLFGSKQIAHDRHKQASSKRVKATSSVEEKAMVSSGLWPSACYLADADIYALPYTIPY
ncbi:hypothetical protein MKX01_037231 [Papaver californicum]|nr:hypothetical protein MKX01_037231 [Papaver californicum]